jgi:formiminoglutamase
MPDEPRRQWLQITRGELPLVLAMPHTGVEIPAPLETRLVSLWLARKDTDWWIDRLYGFAASLGATIVRTAISRTVIDVNRDPSGASLYPGRATTELCPTTTFDGEALYAPGQLPEAAEIAQRRVSYFEPYHAAIREQLARLRSQHRAVVLYDCHSIRSVIPRLFAGTLPHFNIGTNDGASCSGSLTAAVEAICDATGLTRVTNGRFKGGFTTRHYGSPAQGIHAIQMELTCRSYLREPEAVTGPADWPAPFDAAAAALAREALRDVLQACVRFAGGAR